MSEVLPWLLLWIGVSGIFPRVVTALRRFSKRRQPAPLPAPSVEMFGDLRLSEIRLEWAIKRQEKKLRRLGVRVTPFDLSPSTRDWLKNQRALKQQERFRERVWQQHGVWPDRIVRAHQMGVSVADLAETMRGVHAALNPPLSALAAESRLARDQLEALKNEVEWNAIIQRDREAQALRALHDAVDDAACINLSNGSPPLRRSSG